jgi:hypothetical protein
LLNTSRNSSKSEDPALFLNVIWNAAGQAAGCRGQNEREKSKTSPNLRVGLPQFSTLGLLREQYFKSLNLVSTRRRSDFPMRCRSVGWGMASQTQSTTRSVTQSSIADHTML